jgi:hypothetical protein
MIKVTCAVVVSLAIGAGAGWTMHTSEPAAAPVAYAIPKSSMQAPSGAPGTIDVVLLRSMMREELTAALANERNSGQSAASPVKASPPPSPERVAQRREAVQEIESMLNAGQWGNEQRLGFQQRLALLEPEEAERVLRRVVVGLNEGTIRVTTDGPPL